MFYFILAPCKTQTAKNIFFFVSTKMCEITWKIKRRHKEEEYIIPVLFWLPFAWVIFFLPFTFFLYVSLKLKWAFRIQLLLDLVFLIHSAALHLLIGEFNLFMFKVILGMQGLTTAVLLFSVILVPLLLSSLNVFLYNLYFSGVL